MAATIAVHCRQPVNAAPAPTINAVDIRAYGAKGDGISDTSPAIEAAMNSADTILIPPGDFFLRKQVSISTAKQFIGSGPSSKVKWQGSGSAFHIQDGPSPTAFVRDVTITKLGFENTLHSPLRRPTAVTANNAINLRISDCTFLGTGGLTVSHKLASRDRYSRTAGSNDTDPAVLAGFSPDTLDDLNSYIYFTNNVVDGLDYMVQGVRIDFTKHFLISDNTIRYGSISWWGGGAKRSEGGDWKHLRRVYDGQILRNTCTYANGGIYGNNGSDIHIAENTCTNIVDAGIDLEGCQNCVVERNIVQDCGNFCYSIFYGSRNNTFRLNTGIQSGAAAGINRRMNVTKFGPNDGNTLFAWRTNGFGSMPDDVNVTIEDNQFIYTGKAAAGLVSHGASNNTDFTNNTCSNVLVKLNRKSTGRVLISNNTFEYTNTIDAIAGPLIEVTACRSSGGIQILENVIKLESDPVWKSALVYINQSGMPFDIPIIISQNMLHSPGSSGSAAIFITVLLPRDRYTNLDLGTNVANSLLHYD